MSELVGAQSLQHYTDGPENWSVLDPFANNDFILFRMNEDKGDKTLDLSCPDSLFISTNILWSGMIFLSHSCSHPTKARALLVFNNINHTESPA